MTSKYKFDEREDGLWISGGYLDKPMKVIKAWESMNGWYWFAFELKDTFKAGEIIVSPRGEQVTKKDYHQYFGLVQGHEEELGYFSDWEFDEINAGKRMPLVWELTGHGLLCSGRRS